MEPRAKVLLWISRFFKLLPFLSVESGMLTFAGLAGVCSGWLLSRWSIALRDELMMISA